MLITPAASIRSSEITAGLYGEVLPNHGAPLRLAVPWKYGFKHIV